MSPLSFAPWRTLRQLLLFPCLALVAIAATRPVAASAADRVDLDLSGPGWSLWFDRDAPWRDDKLHFPAPPLNQLPIHPPTGGWASLASSAAKPVSVPGTVEEYLQTVPGPAGDLTGVSWWSRTITLPAASAPRTVLLRFESIRQRAEVFVNRQLAGYDIVGNSPLEFDITRFVTPGQPCEIAVRVTDPAGNFDWRDSQPMLWGKHAFPLSHGFGGITGRVRLVVCAPVHIADIYVQNTPALTTANAHVTIRNPGRQPVQRDVIVRVREHSPAPASVGAAPATVLETTLTDITLQPGENVVTARLHVPQARLWDVDRPNLYVCEASLRSSAPVADADADSASQTFGFRWFAIDGIGQDAVLRLNGRRFVARTAISWGFWPINGIYPTSELAARQIRTAKAMGLNMLNFHRAIGNPVVLEQADALGLLYFEEPGAYKSVDREPFGQPLAREKFLRMVRRDRSHPSLVIYNLINEWDSRNPHPNPAEIARHRDDMAAAREIDPSRLILHTSAWARGVDIEDPAKLHFRPFDAQPYLNGWYDVHHAGGPATWNESLYRNPDNFYGRTENRREVVFWGEEGAISTPPRLDRIAAELKAGPRLGWDGAMYLDWHATFTRFLDEKHLRAAFLTVDALTCAMGAVSLGHQGRRIENMRMSNVGDGYAINGWEAEIVENHSGAVDCFRNPKADPAIIAYYNQPLYVAVKLRTTVVHPPAALLADFYIVNETNLHGPHQLEIVTRDAAGRELARAQRAVTVTGGDTFGELIAAAVSLPLDATVHGSLRVDARLLDASGAERARGHDDAVAVDWRGVDVPGSGAVWETEDHVGRFLTQEMHLAAPAFRPDAPRLDWIAVARGPAEGEPTPLPASRLTLPDGSGPGLRTTFFRDLRLTDKVHERIDPAVTYAVDDGAAPDPALSVMTNYGVRWEGRLTAPAEGTYTFVARASGGVRLLIDGHLVIESQLARNPPPVRGSVPLRRNQPVSFTLELRHLRGNAACEVSWIAPETDSTIAPSILERVRRDGTTLVILERAESWMPLITGAANPVVTYDGAFKVGKAWLGGIHFAREHPLFAGLPVNAALDWPYQAVVRNGDERTGLLLHGEDLAAGCYHSYPMQLGTAVGVIPFGRGKIVFSTLDICSQLDSREGPAHVARRLLLNYLRFR
ncbi:PA14 domain-containing protein [Opitutus sp. ER46]|uniref:PA14 domain-containing protein n=1 Tax=Opitutus sp. ER46 TaxID=2161864 RepID=UPI000D310E90|nr:PA14 domain-containing protein [Opitutus sp. ER46]PTX97908.1 hypothetical protein DB354_06410 [Opitutus sp. ER46]